LTALGEETEMIAAVYARKSTEQNGVADEEKSVTRQVEHGERDRPCRETDVEHARATASGVEPGDRL
jgi:hypothetical protein